MASDLKTTSNEAIEAIDLQERILKDISALIWLPNSDAKGHSFVAKLGNFASNIFRSIRNSVGSLLRTVNDVSADVLETMPNVTEISLSCLGCGFQCLSKVKIVGACDLGPRCGPRGQECGQIWFVLADLANSVDRISPYSFDNGLIRLHVWLSLVVGPASCVVGD